MRICSGTLQIVGPLTTRGRHGTQWPRWYYFVLICCIAASSESEIITKSIVAAAADSLVVRLMAPGRTNLMDVFVFLDSHDVNATRCIEFILICRDWQDEATLEINDPDFLEFSPFEGPSMSLDCLIHIGMSNGFVAMRCCWPSALELDEAVDCFVVA